MRFNDIRKTDHYKLYHEKEVPWNKVLEIILNTKSKRKKGDKVEIKNGYYILCEMRNNVLYVINAKITK